MTTAAAPAVGAATPSALRCAARAAAISGGLTLAVAARVALNGPGVGPAFAAGIVFGALLIGLAVATGQPIGRPRLVGVAAGFAGGIVLVLLPVVARPGPSLPLGTHPEPFALWHKHFGEALSAIAAGNPRIVVVESSRRNVPTIA